MFLTPGPDWRQEGHDWPNRSASLFVHAAGLRWHVQRAGTGPTLLLLHGTAAATHSWRDLFSRLTERFDTIAPDLPGHGFTQAPASHRLSLPGMARALGELLHVLGTQPVLIVGHSAGAAIATRMALDGQARPRAILSFNGAFLPFRGMQGPLFSQMARMFFVNPLIPRVFSFAAGDPKGVERLIRETGSTIDRAGVEFYSRMIRSPGHVAAALGMMSNWDLEPLVRDLKRLQTRLVLVAADNDTAVPPDQAEQVARLAPDATVAHLRGLGHLAHEERPDLAADLVLRLAAEVGVG